jgi:tetratricopeptide (TPR) repeat protein
MERSGVIFALVGLAMMVGGCTGARMPEEPKVTPMLADDGGLGPVHHWISTKNPVAQRAFDEGLAYLYGFNHDEAAKAFKRAADADPECAMALWGQALVMGPNYNLPDVDPQAQLEAFKLVTLAKQRAAGRATQQERDYIDTLATRYSDDPKADFKQLQVRYSTAMGQLARKYPDDLDAATLYAESLMNLNPWKLYTLDGLPQPGADTVVATLESVLERNANHVGANHYYIHAVEASLRPQRGLECAKRLTTLAPRQGHLVHMPAHIYIRTGDYAAAVKANQAAIAADDKYISCCHPPPRGVYPVMYYNHNVHFLAVAACMTNQSKLALLSARRLAEGVRPIAAEMPMVEPYVALPNFVMVRFGMWDQILSSAEASTSVPTPSTQPALPTTEATRHFARAMALAARKDVAGARAEQEQFESARAAIPAGNLMGNNTVGSVLEVASHLLAGRIAAAAGDRRAAIDALGKAVDCQDHLAYDEPPAFPWPVRESLGTALLANGQSLAAEQVFREDLRRNPNNPRSLLGLWRALAAQERTTEAGAARRAFEQVEKGGDVLYGIDDL